MPHENLYPDPTPIPNQWPKPKWAQNLIEGARDGFGNSAYRRRTQSQYQDEHVAPSHTASLSIEWCNKLLGKCYLMIVNDQQLVPMKNKIDHSIPPPEIRNTKYINQTIRKLRGSHVLGFIILPCPN